MPRNPNRVNWGLLASLANSQWSFKRGGRCAIQQGNLKRGRIQEGKRREKEDTSVMFTTMIFDTTVYFSLCFRVNLKFDYSCDSAVMCRGGTALDLSKDHKPMAVTEKSRIEWAGGFVNGVRGRSRHSASPTCVWCFHVE